MPDDAATLRAIRDSEKSLTSSMNAGFKELRHDIAEQNERITQIQIDQGQLASRESVHSLTNEMQIDRLRLERLDGRMHLNERDVQEIKVKPDALDNETKEDVNRLIDWYKKRKTVGGMALQSSIYLMVAGLPMAVIGFGLGQLAVHLGQ